ncbi:MAG: fimbrial biogenesis chaperone [Cetobacterium sp.]|uniref:fimbrial biogenesis chaperone n=1 Tax=Cetobacterium sp. TaxID=2071632 RepID=UPI003F29FD4E
MKRNLNCLVIFIMLSFTVFGFFRTSVAPGVFDVSLDRPVTEEIIVVNNSNEPIRLKVYTGKEEGVEEREYLGEWIRVFPRMLTLDANSERRVKFSVRPPKDITNGEYKGLIFIEELPDVVEGKTTLTLAGRHGLTVYGIKGKIDYKEISVSNIKFENKNNNKVELVITLANKSRYSIKPEVLVKYLDKKGKIIEESKMRGSRILKDKIGTIKGELIATKGESIEVTLISKGQQLYKQNIKLK